MTDVTLLLQAPILKIRDVRFEFCRIRLSWGCVSWPNCGGVEEVCGLSGQGMWWALIVAISSICDEGRFGSMKSCLQSRRTVETVFCLRMFRDGIL